MREPEREAAAEVRELLAEARRRGDVRVSEDQLLRWLKTLRYAASLRRHHEELTRRGRRDYRRYWMQKWRADNPAAETEKQVRNKMTRLAMTEARERRVTPNSVLLEWGLEPLRRGGATVPSAVGRRPIEGPPASVERDA